MDAPVRGSKDHVKSGINSNTTLGLSPEVVALSSGLSPGYLSQHPPPGLSHLRTTYLHLYSYLVITASSLRSHLGITASSFGLSPRHHSIIPRLLCSLLWLLTCVHSMLPWAFPWGFCILTGLSLCCFLCPSSLGGLHNHWENLSQTSVCSWGMAFTAFPIFLHAFLPFWLLMEMPTLAFPVYSCVHHVVCLIFLILKPDFSCLRGSCPPWSHIKQCLHTTYIQQIFVAQISNRTRPGPRYQLFQILCSKLKEYALKQKLTESEMESRHLRSPPDTPTD